MSAARTRLGVAMALDWAVLDRVTPDGVTPDGLQAHAGMDMVTAHLRRSLYHHAEALGAVVVADTETLDWENETLGVRVRMTALADLDPAVAVLSDSSLSVRDG